MVSAQNIGDAASGDKPEVARLPSERQRRAFLTLRNAHVNFLLARARLVRL
jgi:hypothetical protein